VASARGSEGARRSSSCASAARRFSPRPSVIFAVTRAWPLSSLPHPARTSPARGGSWAPASPSSPAVPTRQESVRLALEATPPGVRVALVHDAVRPFITRALVDAVLTAARADGAAICALPVAETVKRVRDGVVEATIERAGLWTVQTPQAFRAAILREAHDKARRDGVAGTDDAMLVERLGHRVRVVPGLAGNVKITTPDDLRRARETRSTRGEPR